VTSPTKPNRPRYIRAADSDLAFGVGEANPVTNGVAAFFLLPSHRKCHRERTVMKTQYAIPLAMLAGAVLGGVAMHGLHAQTKPQAYQVIEVNVKDPDLYKQYAEQAMPLQIQYSARFIARGSRVDSLAGLSFLHC
jgi:hypothetical protein